MLIFNISHGEVITSIAIDHHRKPGMPTRTGIIIAVKVGGYVHIGSRYHVIHLVVTILYFSSGGDFGFGVPIYF